MTYGHYVFLEIDPLWTTLVTDFVAFVDNRGRTRVCVCVCVSRLALFCLLPHC
jgi:hypothetical protein